MKAVTNSTQFKNIIFDLGGVFINLDEEQTVKRFIALSQLPEAKIREQILTFEEYKAFEKGLIPDYEFREIVRQRFRITGNDETIDECLNAMLLDIPPDRLQLLKNLNGGHQLFLLSNTNQIHLKRFNQIINETTGDDSIDSYFTKAYYSHHVGMRKPDKEIFDYVLAENKLDASATLFLDDNVTNLEGAKLTGIHTFHVKNPSQLFELFA